MLLVRWGHCWVRGLVLLGVTVQLGPQGWSALLQLLRAALVCGLSHSMFVALTAGNNCVCCCGGRVMVQVSAVWVAVHKMDK